MPNYKAPLTAGTVTLIGVIVGGGGSMLFGTPAMATVYLMGGAIAFALAVALVVRSAIAEQIGVLVELVNSLTHLDRRGSVREESRKKSIGLAEVDSTIEKLRVTLTRMREMATTDSITGLPNRSQFEHELDCALQAVDAGEQAALLFVDLDHFKAVNDSLGHAVGDSLLESFADRWRAFVDMATPAPNEQTSFTRLAGDEFAIVMYGSFTGGAVQDFAEKLLLQLDKPFDLFDKPLSIAASIGIALAPRDGSDRETLIRNADTAMYYAKEAGRNQAILFETKMHERAIERLDLERDLRLALANREFVLEFQPQLNAATGEIVAVEALIRWHHPVRGRLTPPQFLKVAEESGLMIEIGDWVINSALAALSRWQRDGLNIRMAVNVSVRQLDTPDFVPRLKRAIQRTRADPTMLELEVTESLIMLGEGRAAESLEAARAMGVSIAIDDFGVSYSNFDKLKSLPVDRVKIDRSLAKDIQTCSDSRAIVNAIVNLVDMLGYETVAEGIETDAQRDLLKIAGCDVVQGFAFAEPMGEDGLFEWLQEAVPDKSVRRVG